ncbi:hypothetical protein [Algiphilus sp.]|uniref:HNH endonuclease n=1 Tax=Algiphilus sp. TaxID=1872431 RepID=UPI0025B8B4D9|nr:hypothetical protein [Algiphilus sp.]MCK5772022.1 hypothetical protein [Algiphilus sp.]
MPIAAANRARYPADWPQIRERILARANHCCERCGVPNHVYRRDDDTLTSDPLLADSWELVDGHQVARIVLTIAHLDDPDPANCDDDNLAALCQRCHNRLDGPMRAQHAYMTRRAGKAVGDLFGGDA